MFILCSAIISPAINKRDNNIFEIDGKLQISKVVDDASKVENI